MERHPIIRRLVILMLALGLVFALGACGGLTDADALLEDAEQIETITEEPAAGDEPGTQPAEEESGKTDEGAGDGEEGGEGEGAGDGEEGGEGEGAGDGEEGEGGPEDTEITYGEEPTIDGVVVTQTDIDAMDLSGKTLRGDFSGFDFSNKDFSNATLAGAKFDRAIFKGARFSGVTFWYGSFVGADFTDAKLAGADLSYGIFENANFTSAMMPGNSFKYVEAIFDGATWVDGVKVCGLDSVGGCN